MEVNAKLTKQISEAKYLTEENCYRYRPILRYFYEQYEKIKYWMYKEDVFNELKKHTQFESYTIENLKSDLDRLVEWGNLIPVQDTSKASTIEEFKNKQFRYQLSEYSVEFERFCIKLENLVVEGASLESSLFERIRDEILKIHELLELSDKEVGGWWRNLDSDFKRLNQNYQDYYKSFNNASGEERMKSKEFLIYKDALISYLREFVKELQKNSSIIEGLLCKVNEEYIDKVLKKVFEYEKSIPRLDGSLDEKLLWENINGKWRNLKDWFVSENGVESEASRVFDLTNEIIRKITRYASQIAESRNSAANRKEEYKKVCDLFLKCNNEDELHKLSSVIFGLFGTRHFKADFDRKTESINSSVFDEIPLEFDLKPRIRGAKEKSERRGIEDKSERKQKMLEEYLRKVEEEIQILQGYIVDSKICFANLSNIEPSVRNTLLKWIGKAISTPDRKGKTEDGRQYKILLPQDNRRCLVECTDGVFDTPAFIIEFKEGTDN